MATYITFGQTHAHRVNGRTLDCDSVAKVDNRESAIEMFGRQFMTNYTEDQIKTILHYFPRGIIDLTSQINRGE